MITCVFPGVDDEVLDVCAEVLGTDHIGLTRYTADQLWEIYGDAEDEAMFAEMDAHLALMIAPTQGNA